MPIITEKQGQGQMHGLYFDGTLQKGQNPAGNEAVERIIHEDGMKITCRHFFTLPWDPRATDGTPWPVAGAMLIRLNKYEYLLAGNGVVVQFENEGERQIQKKLGEDGFVEAGTNQRTTEDQIAIRWRLPAMVRSNTFVASLAIRTTRAATSVSVWTTGRSCM